MMIILMILRMIIMIMKHDTTTTTTATTNNDNDTNSHDNTYKYNLSRRLRRGRYYGFYLDGLYLNGFHFKVEINIHNNLQALLSSEAAALVSDATKPGLRWCRIPASSSGQMYFYMHPGGVGQVMSKFVFLEYLECGTHKYTNTIMTCTHSLGGHICTSYLVSCHVTLHIETRPRAEARRLWKLRSGKTGPGARSVELSKGFFRLRKPLLWHLRLPLRNVELRTFES